MPQIINTNIASLNSQRNLNTSQTQLATALQRLSSGLRINSAKDDAAGLAIAERFTTQIRGLNQAARNANDGISLSQTAEGALGELTNNLQRIRELAVQAANSTNSASDRAALDQEVQQRLAEVDRIASQTSFNGQKILDGTFGNASFQVGANVGETISISLSTSMKGADIGSYVNSSSTESVAVTPTETQTVGTITATTDVGSYTGVTSSNFDGSNFSINGTFINDSTDYAGSATEQGAGSAYAKAAAINASGVAGVSASATNVLTFSAVGGTPGTDDFLALTTVGTGSDIAYELTINGQAVFTKAIDAATDEVSIDEVVAAINDFTSDTGVSASNVGGDLQLTAADGRDITIGESILDTGTSTVAQTVGTSVFGAFDAGGATNEIDVDQEFTHRGSLTLQSSGNVTLGGTQALAGFSATLLSATSNLSSQNVLDVTAANNTILSIDAALTSVSTLRSTFGAIQNRFESTISNLQATAENLTASRSRIQDTDFASETAALTRAQILQQAGTAMLAQANALPNQVLTLLRG
jgi:flagellin